MQLTPASGSTDPNAGCTLVGTKLICTNGASAPSTSLSTPAPGDGGSATPAQIKATEPAVNLNLRFAGQYFDAESNLAYNAFRSYQPSQGRYTQSDPVGLAGGWSRFGYSGSDGINYADPLGLCVGPLAPACAWALANAPWLVPAGVATVEASAMIASGAVSPASGVPSIATKAVSSVAKGAQVCAYEAGAFNALKGRSLPGDMLDIHHVMQKHPAAQAIPGYNALTAPAIAVPRSEHLLIPPLQGNYSGTARGLLAKDIRDLRNFTNAPNANLQELIILNKSMYPSAFTK